MGNTKWPTSAIQLRVSNFKVYLVPFLVRIPTFYHYTDDEGARNIIRSGTIQASLKFMSNGRDVAYGNGVYLTALTPESPKRTIARNNWQNNNEKGKKLLRPRHPGF